MLFEATVIASRASSYNVGSRKLLTAAVAGQHSHICRFPATRPWHSSTTITRSLRHKRPFCSSSSRAHQDSGILPEVKQYTAKNLVSIFRSYSNDPYYNLAVENHLLKHSDTNSRILFTYTNRPCVVIGRNQNPWLECNIQKIQEGLKFNVDEWQWAFNQQPSQAAGDPNIPLDLVRRRSGGGTVIHDEGNLNFSFIVPNDASFSRNKHAQLVVDALEQYKNNGPYLREAALYHNVRVNERHDIVMVPKNSTNQQKEFKASGSAFKLTRGRALHHGTLLLSSPNIARSIDHTQTGPSTFSILLSSPAKPFLVAKGVGSVRSPVHNLFQLSKDDDRRRLSCGVEDLIANAFRKFYHDQCPTVVDIGKKQGRQDLLEDIRSDMDEMMTDSWRFCQTPSFQYASKHDGTAVQFQVKHGMIENPKIETNNNSLRFPEFAGLEGRKLHEVQSWAEYIHSNSISTTNTSKVLPHLSTIFPRIHLADKSSATESGNVIIKESSDLSEDVDVIQRRSTNNQIEVERKGQNVIVET